MYENVEPIVVNNDIPDPEFIRREDETIFEFTQRIRTANVEKLMQDGLPTDAKDVYALSAILDSMDRQELAKAKLEIDSKQSKSDEQAQALISALINAVGNVNPYESKAAVEREPLPELSTEGVTLIEGEMDTVPRDMNFDSFMKEHRQKNPKPTDD